MPLNQIQTLVDSYLEKKEQEKACKTIKSSISVTLDRIDECQKFIGFLIHDAKKKGSVLLEIENKEEVEQFLREMSQVNEKMR